MIVEDSQDDVNIIIRELKRAGFDPAWRRVETKPAFLAEIANPTDLIISDYSMPEFTGLEAARLLRERGSDIPFILLSGTVGEDVAVEAMKHGATDYLLKDRIARLGLAVEQALEQKRLHMERKRVETALNLFRTLVDRSIDGIEVVDPETGRFLDVNETSCERLGYTRDELLAMSVPDIEIAGVDAASWRQVTEEIRGAGFKIIQGLHRRKDGSTFPVEVSVRHVKLDREYLIAAVRDVTERRRADEEIRTQLRELQRWHQAMLDREDRVLELKREVNELLARQQLPPRYAESVPS